MKLNVQETNIFHSPYAFIDKQGEPMLIKLLEEKSHQRLIEMYLRYEPRNSFNGLPPIRDKACVSWVRRMIDTGANLIAISFHQGVMGHAALFPMDDTRCEIMVAVSHERQKMGIGTELSKCAIQMAYEIGFDAIWLCVEFGNQVARHVFRKVGFEYLSPGADSEVEMNFDLTRYHQKLKVAVSQIMKRDVCSIHHNVSCREAIATCLGKRISALPVTDTNNEVIGILTSTDLLGATNFRQRVSDVVTRGVVTVRENCAVAKVVRLFQSKNLRCIPVVDDNGKLVGIVGRREILKYYMDSLQPEPANAGEPDETPTS